MFVSQKVMSIQVTNVQGDLEKGMNRDVEACYTISSDLNEHGGLGKESENLDRNERQHKEKPTDWTRMTRWNKSQLQILRGFLLCALCWH